MENTQKTFGSLFRFREAFRNLFKKKLNEPLMESQVEANWEAVYKEALRFNLTEIFAARMTNYTLSESWIECTDEAINEALQRLIEKWYKWVQMAYGVGRAYLIPYCIGDNIYTDIIPQGRAWTTSRRGDDVTGIGTMSDVRWIGKEMFVRMTSYEWNPDTLEFTIENKATRRNGSQVALTVVDEWADIEPLIVIKGAEKPLFAFVDCPKDNRTTDELQGAPLTFGCGETIDEILECFAQYKEEFELKQTWLGVDRAMLDKNGQPDRSKLYKTFIGKNTESLFEIFSPDIRDAAYSARILQLFAKLEKQVGTSSGILTPADTANATATQVRRSMYDTLAMVSRMRHSIDIAVDRLCYIYTVYLSLIGKPFEADYSIKKEWSDDMWVDRTEQFAEIMQAHGAKAVKTEEVRQFVLPFETAEEAEEAVKAIRESEPDPVIPEFFGE